MFQNMWSALIVMRSCPKDDRHTVVFVVCVKMQEFCICLLMSEVICCEIKISNTLYFIKLKSMDNFSFLERICSLDSFTVESLQDMSESSRTGLLELPKHLFFLRNSEVY